VPVVNAAAPAPAVKAAEEPAKEVVRKAEPRTQTVAKMPDSAWPGDARARRDAGVSDTQWLDAVRQALVTHDASAATVEAKREPVEPVKAPAVIEAPVQPPVAREAVLPVAVPPPVTPAAPAVAPVLPPAAAIAVPPAPPVTAAAPPPATKADEHPVPPGAIPDPAEVAAADANDHRSRVRRWIAKIPLMGNVIDNGLQ
jgi:fused signal recognition particle receptor